MRKILVTMVTGALAVFAVACGGGGNGSGTAGTAGNGEPPQLTNPATVPTSTPIDGSLTYVIRDNGVSAPDGSGMAVSGEPTTTSGSRGVYTIVSGDTCFGIADTLGTTVEALEEANVALDCGALQPGVELRIPADSANATETEAPDTDTPGAETPTPPAGDSGLTYTIQSGDLCDDIAASYGVDVDELIALNGLDCSNLQVGQTVQIP